MYEKVRKAAEARLAGDSRGAWGLADALVAEVPAQLAGRPRNGKIGRDVATDLARIAEELEDDGIDTPAGQPYTTRSLHDLRLVALGWPKNERCAQAAFRTHQEAGTADSFKREVLAALCQAAETEDWDKPEDLEITDEAWAAAIEGIRHKVKIGVRYTVAANDLRAALSRKRNTPEKEKDEDALHAVEFIQEGIEKIEHAQDVLARKGRNIEEIREAIEAMIERLAVQIEWLRTLLQSGGVTDESLERLLNEESR